MPPHRLLLVVLTAAAIPLYGGITVETSLPDNTLISNPDVLDGAGNDDGSSRFAKMHAALQAHAPNETAERDSGHPKSSRFPALVWKMISRLTIQARCRTSRIRSRPFPPACSPALPLSFPKHPSPPGTCPKTPDRQSLSP